MPMAPILPILRFMPGANAASCARLSYIVRVSLVVLFAVYIGKSSCEILRQQGDVN